MSTTSILLLAPSARKSRWDPESAATPSNVPAATTGIAAWRTVDWQLAQAPSRTAPPAAASMGTTAVQMAARIEPAGFIKTETCRYGEVRAGGESGYLSEASPAATSSRRRSRVKRPTKSGTNWGTLEPASLAM